VDNSVTISPTATTVNLKANTVLESDINPSLGGNLELNGNTIKTTTGGNIESKIWNVDVQALNSLVSILMESNQSTIDMGYFSAPTGYVVSETGYTVDMGSFLDPAVGNNIEFGVFNPMTG
jgi:hypothetical protein